MDFWVLEDLQKKILKSFTLVFRVVLGRAWQGIRRDQSHTVLSGCPLILAIHV